MPGACAGIEHVDVDRDVDRPVAEALAQLVDDLAHALVVDVGRRDDAESEPAVVLEVLLAVQRSTRADVGQRLGVEEALLDRPAERGAVGVLGAEVGVPGVQVGVEVHQRDRAVLLRRRRAAAGSAMVWSPPIVTRLVPSAVRSTAAASMVSMASWMLKGFTAMSPASTTWAISNGDTSSAGLYGRSRRDDSRTCVGPNRAPGR